MSVLLFLALGSVVSAETTLEDVNQARVNCELAKERQNDLAMEYWCSNGAPAIKSDKAASSHSEKEQPASANTTKVDPVGEGEEPHVLSKSEESNAK